MFIRLLVLNSGHIYFERTTPSPPKKCSAMFFFPEKPSLPSLLPWLPQQLKPLGLLLLMGWLTAFQAEDTLRKDFSSGGEEEAKMNDI